MSKQKILVAFAAILGIVLGATGAVFAQKPVIGGSGTGGYVLTQEGGAITTAVPFLLVSPDARSGGLADIGAASAPDANSQHWNAAKYPFLSEDLSLSLTYSPWLLNMVPDMSLAYLTAAKKVDQMSTVAFSLLFFSMGEVLFRQSVDDPGTPYYPNEFAIDASYSRKLIEDLSIAVTGRFIYSNLTAGQNVGGDPTKAGLAGAVDIGLYYQHMFDLKGFEGGLLSAGLSITNIGNKISYVPGASTAEKDFLPANLRLGVGFDWHIDSYNHLAFLGEINKLLVPTPPLYDPNGNIVAGMDNGVPVFTGIIHSFYDAPGGFGEEMKEIQWSLGAEYWWNSLVAARLGYFHESMDKGARQYMTIGAGIRYNIFGLDLSYLIPTTQVSGSNPLKNTLRFSLLFQFASTKRKNNQQPQMAD
ncbi:MAG: type IX secretion system outer membrane channel protein PorV [Bacteroidales bacterium]|nr:type IX secretion system outer membrane channel protein PorV [Bacteroidales bacterium]